MSDAIRIGNLCINLPDRNLEIRDLDRPEQPGVLVQRADLVAVARHLLEHFLTCEKTDDARELRSLYSRVRDWLDENDSEWMTRCGELL